ncbi:hypothetical protein BGZ99_000677 [Dissophora globulifera]|uniref:Uncharacterized protein n=1 Tax=Dissophora globulifera TaxID=979702 RepID=A0A9P6R1Q3_9FUNG|nr:hypothetical protein BGZ99_000677 [Dissophora globulifera]
MDAAADSEKYLEQSSLRFTSTELGAFHRFHAYNWDADDQFQAGLHTITQAQATEPSFSELLKMKQYYFSTRMNTRINLDDYLAWRKHLEQPSDDPNVDIFRRFDEYDFDNDRKFQQGLPSIVGQLIKDGKSTLDKAALQKEMTKAKAFYFARFIELFDFAAYLEWKDMAKAQTGPACPYAHLWQNKGKGSGIELPEDAEKFLTTTLPVSTGALKIHVHSPATMNVWTSTRLAKMSQAIAPVADDTAITSVFWTANTGTSSQDTRDSESQIASKDEKWFTGGIVTSGSTEVVTSTQNPATGKELLRQYYSLVDQMSELRLKHQKPIVAVVDGMVSLSAAYLAFGSGAQCVITENATLSFTPLASIEPTPNEVTNPFAGLYLLGRIQAKAIIDSEARLLAKGVGTYLAFCPDYMLRGPDLRKLGLADFFVSSSKKKDIEEATLSVAGCPPPHTTQAIRMTLNAEIVYPGPAKIDVWRPEIQECFGDAESLKEVVSNLTKYDNNWSKSIRAYIAALEPVYAKLLFEAVKRASQLSSFQECARLEYRLVQRYQEYLATGSKDETGNDLDAFFEPIESEEADLFNFPFSDWIQQHGKQDEFNSATEAAQSRDNGHVAVPSDHPNIPGVDFTDPEAAKACPFLSAKAKREQEASSTVVPTDHPKIPGVDFSDPEAIKACPFLSAKAKKEQEAPSTLVPADHPNIPGVDFSDPEAVKACPFLSAKAKRKEQEASSAAVAVPADHPKIPGVDFSNPEAAKACPFLAAQNAS